MPKKIVYIEDDLEMTYLIKMILERKGYEIISTNDGMEGFEIIEREKPDLVLLDLMMPNIDGWDIYHQLKSNENTNQIPVIVISAKAQPIDKVLGIQIAKVNNYISKPFKPQELLESIESILN
ncbi:MAG: two-component system response regulator [Chloroflexi bacterium HGW-Chloroflexi-2]|jgi:DNA-binding response OmpR family regulator|nr:MAG: two-component system response regulator [Chloroflexi bacterium HGW-Chloroflexi-2]